MPKVRALGAYEAKFTLCGWAGPEIAKEAFNVVCGGMPVFSSIGPVNDYKGKRQMLWEFTRKVLGKDTENFAQEVGDCFPAGTMVRISDGSEKPIETISVGEFVMSASGKTRRVNSTIKKIYSGELVTIQTKGQPRSVTATPDHCMRTIVNGEESWSPIGELRVKDRVLIPSRISDEKYSSFDLSLGLEDSYEVTPVSVRANRGRKSKSCKRIVETTIDFGWLIGLYLAEGSSTTDDHGRPTRIDFNLGTHECELIKKTVKTVEVVFGITPKIVNLPSKPSVTLVRIDNSAIARFVKRLVPGNTYTKRVPITFLSASPDVRMEVLRGWIEGDGHGRVDGNCAKILGVSVCHQLTTDMYHIANSLGLKASVNFSKTSSARKSAARLAIYGESAMSVMPSLRSLIDTELARQPWAKRSDLVDNGLSSPVKEIDRFHTGDDVFVYCLEVSEDHSFIANGYAVHNCVSFGGKNAMEYLQCVNIILNNAVEEFHPLFPPYFNGTSRVNVGGGRIQGDGSTGAWLQQAIKQYGVLRRDDPSVPKYTGSIARQWGSYGPPQNFIIEGQKHLVQTTAQVNTAADVASSLLSGYPVVVCSNQGFTMEAGSDGFHKPRGSWGHCMLIIGFEDHPQYGLYFLVLNSWGDVHGHLKDFTTGVDLPIGIIRAKGRVIDSMVSMRDSFSYSQFNGFPDNSDRLNKALFDVVGD